MAQQKAIRCVVVPVALLALLVLTTTLAGAWHHHNCSNDSNCSICHFSHQPMDQPLASHRAPALALIGAHPDPQIPLFYSGPEFRRLPARAPPSA